MTITRTAITHLINLCSTAERFDWTKPTHQERKRRILMFRRALIRLDLATLDVDATLTGEELYRMTLARATVQRGEALLRRWKDEAAGREIDWDAYIRDSKPVLYVYDGVEVTL